MGVLFVAALEEESAALADAVEVLHLGVGKVQAATTLSRHLADHAGEVDLVVNVGTAGGLRDQAVGEVHEVATVHQHDFDAEALSAFVGRRLPGGPLTLPGPEGAGARLATGDRLVLDPRERARLGLAADLVDMEGYAVAATCASFGVGAWLAKAVSDSADEHAAPTWKDALEVCSAALAAWADRRGLLG